MKGIFGIGRFATKLKELESRHQIGPWHIGKWTDFKHTAIRIRFDTVDDGETAKRARRDMQASLSNEML
jgi:hypothetical protein